MAILPDLLRLSTEDKIALFDQFVQLACERVNLDKPEQPKPPSIKTSIKTSTKKSVKYENVDKLSPDDQAYFDKLKKWRNQVAKDLDWAPYMILDNKTLMAIAHYRPATEEDLLKIKGMGVEKLGRYSSSILEIISEPTPQYQRKLVKSLDDKIPTKRFLGPNKLEQSLDFDFD